MSVSAIGKNRPFRDLSGLKVAIATIFENQNNYGQRLQAYALCRFIRDQFGCNCVVVDARRNRNELKSFQEFQDRSMGTIRISCQEDIRKFSPDAVVLGGDQVLNVDWFSLGSIGGGILKMGYEQFSYSSSDGGYSMCGSSEKVSDNVKILKGFLGLSVREVQTKPYLEKKTGMDVNVHLDPVFLLDAGHWRSLERKPEFIKDGEVFDVEYKCEDSPFQEHVQKDGSKKYGIFGNNVRNDGVSPENFLWMIDHCRKFQTSSFHGTAFAYIFRRPQIKISNLGNLRVKSMMEKLEVKVCGETVEYGDFDRVLASEVGKSREYLRKNL